MMLKRLLRRDNKGIGAVEFALVAPVLISFVIGISQMGKLFFANADMKNAMAHGARVASVWPVPGDAAILAAVDERLARSTAVADSTVAVVRGTDERGNDFVRIDMDYEVPLDFIFFELGPVTLEDSRKVYIQMAGNVPQNPIAGTTSTTTGGTTSSTTGGTTSSTTTGGTTSSTSATSAGGTTSSTSATSASSTSASSSGSNASSGSNSNSSGSNASSGSNSNSSGGGHGHGSCKNNKC